MIRIIFILIIALVSGCGAGNDRPRGAEDISYWEPAWYDNEHIIYTKQVDTVKFHYGLLADLANMRSELTRRDWFICVTDLEGKEERILKQFSVVDPEAGGDVRKIFMVDGDKEVIIGGLGDSPQRPSSYSCVGGLITFAGRYSEGGIGVPGPIYVMNKDGTGIRKIVEDYGDNPRLSPDGKQVLYRGINPTSLWIVNIDGTGNKKLLDDAGAGVWSPDGERIVYGRPSADENWTEEEIQQGGRKNIYFFNLKTGENKEFIRSSGPPIDWSPDGKRISYGYVGWAINIETGKGEFFNVVTGQWEEAKKVNISEYSKVKQDKIVKYLVKDYPKPLPESEKAIWVSLGYPRISPDWKRSVGDPQIDIKAGKPSGHRGIGIRELGKEKEITVLRIDYVKTTK